MLQCNVLNPETGVSSSMSSVVEIKSKYSRFITALDVRRWKGNRYINRRGHWKCVVVYFSTDSALGLCFLLILCVQDVQAL